MPVNFLCCFSRRSNQNDRQDEVGENGVGDGDIPPNLDHNVEGVGGVRPCVRPSYTTTVTPSTSGISNLHQSLMFSPPPPPPPPTTFITEDFNLDHNVEGVGGARPRVRPSYAAAVTASNSASSILLQPLMLPSQSTTSYIEDIDEILSSLASSSSHASYNNNNNNTRSDEVSEIITLASIKEKYEEKEEEQDRDIEKFYSFKCLICYKSEIPKQVILPCGHSQCCEECFKQMRKRYRRSRRHHLKTVQRESIRPGHDINCPTCRQDGILCHLFLGEEDLTSEFNTNTIGDHL